MSQVRSFQVRVVETPLRRPFVTALGRKTSTVNVGLTLRLASGAIGYGEASASLALAHLAPARLARAITSLARWSVGRDPAELRVFSARGWSRFPGAAPAVSAFECAALDAWTSERGLSVRHWCGGALSRLESDLTVSAVDAASAREAAADAAARGYRILKVKVGSGEREDLERVRAVRAAAPRARLLLDGNQGLTVRSALRLTEAALKAGPVELLEQPLPKADLKGLAAVAKRCPVPVAADESCATPEDAVRLIDAGAATAINIKLAKSGILRGLDIAAAARAAGLPLMIGCMAETARGLTPSVHFALGTGFFRWADLDSDELLVEEAPLRPGWARRGREISAQV